MARWKSYFDLVRDTAQELVCPAARGMDGKERAPDARVHGDKPFILPPEAILGQDLAHGANVEARVLAPYYADVGPARDHVRRSRLAVEDEYKVGVPVQPVSYEEFQVRPRIFRLGICVQHQWSQAGLVTGRSW